MSAPLPAGTRVRILPGWAGRRRGGAAEVARTITIEGAAAGTDLFYVLLLPYGTTYTPGGLYEGAYRGQLVYPATYVVEEATR